MEIVALIALSFIMSAINIKFFVRWVITADLEVDDCRFRQELLEIKTLVMVNYGGISASFTYGVSTDVHATYQNVRAEMSDD